mgnify:CR=1 FL=1
MIPSELIGRLLAFAAVALAVAVKTAAVDDFRHHDEASLAWVASSDVSAPYGLRLLDMQLEPPAVRLEF